MIIFNYQLCQLLHPKFFSAQFHAMIEELILQIAQRPSCSPSSLLVLLIFRDFVSVAEM